MKKTSKTETGGKKIIKIAAAAGIVLVLAIAVELCFNLGNITSGSESLDLTDEITEDIVLAHEGTLVYHESYDEPHYINKLKFEADLTDDLVYGIEIKYATDFEAEDETTIWNTYYTYMPFGMTKVGEAVTEINIFTLTDPADYEITYFGEVNGISINPYRLSGLIIIFGLLALVFCIKDPAERIVPIFVIASLSIGSWLILASGISNTTWDEIEHFNKVYNMANDSDVEWNRAAFEKIKWTLKKPNTTWEERNASDEVYNDLAEDYEFTLDRGYDAIPVTSVGYLHMALAYKLTSIIGMKPASSLYAARFAGLFLFTFLVAMAIHISRDRKLFLAVLSLMPTIIFQGSMITYDSAVYALITLGMVILSNELNSEDKIDNSRLILAFTLIVIGSLPKAPYLPLVLFVYILPKKRFDNPKRYNILLGILISGAVAALALLIIPLVINIVRGTVSFAGDSRGGNVAPAEQVASMIAHPFALIKLYATNIFAMDNLRNLGNPGADNYTMMNLAFLNYSEAGVLKDKWEIIIVPAILFLFFAENTQDRESKLSLKQRIAAGLIVFVIAGMIWSAFYLAFTRVGMEMIDGVQARYFFPLLLPLSFAVKPFLKLNMSRKNYSKMMLSVVIFLNMLGIMTLFMQGLE